MSTPLLEIRGLRTAFATDEALLTAVDGVSFSVEKGRTVGLVGESGCGKSVTAMSIVRLLPQPSGRILDGQVHFQGRDLVTAPVEEMHQVRGGQIGVIFQEPMTALNPVHRVGRQVAEVFRLHQKCSKREAWRQAVEVLAQVGIPSPHVRAMDYPHQLSGGMRQRVVIAMAIALKPALLIADEPTTALDVTVQAQILDLLKKLQQEMGMAVLMITHDLGVIAETCDEVVVMYAGRVVERAPARRLFARPRHAYTRGLLASIPRLETPRKSVLKTIPGMVAPLGEFVEGCRFCQRMGREGTRGRPEFREVGEGHWAEACEECMKDER